MFGNYLFCFTVVLSLCALASQTDSKDQAAFLVKYEGYCELTDRDNAGDFGIQMSNTEYGFWALAVEIIDDDENVYSNLEKEFHNAVFNRRYNNHTLDFEKYMPSLKVGSYAMALGRVIDLLDVTISRNYPSCLEVRELVKHAKSVMSQRQRVLLRTRSDNYYWDCHIIAVKMWEKIFYLMQAKFNELYGRRNYQCENSPKAETATSLDRDSVVKRNETGVLDHKAESSSSPDLTAPREKANFTGIPRFIERLAEA